MNQNTYKKGSWNVICDVCGFKYKKEEVRLRWDGLVVCKEDWESRHPSDFYRSTPDRQSVIGPVRNEPTDDESLAPSEYHVGATLTMGLLFHPSYQLSGGLYLAGDIPAGTGFGNDVL